MNDKDILESLKDKMKQRVAERKEKIASSSNTAEKTVYGASLIAFEYVLDLIELYEER